MTSRIDRAVELCLPERSIAGILLSSFAAGPIFFAILMCSTGFGLFTTADPDSLRLLVLAPYLWIPYSLLVGMIVAFPATFVGTIFMTGLGYLFRQLRSPIAWTLAGGLMGSGGTLVFGFADDGDVALTIILTSMICAFICWRRAIWM